MVQVQSTTWVDPLYSTAGKISKQSRQVAENKGVTSGEEGSEARDQGPEGSETAGAALQGARLRPAEDTSAGMNQPIEGSEKP